MEVANKWTQLMTMMMVARMIDELQMTGTPTSCDLRSDWPSRTKISVAHQNLGSFPSMHVFPIPIALTPCVSEEGVCQEQASPVPGQVNQCGR